MFRVVLNEKTPQFVWNEFFTLLRGRGGGPIDPNRDVDAEAGYPADINPGMYWQMYKREGIGTRAVRVFPQACWAVTPDIWETEDAELTAFESEWKRICKERNLLSYLRRVDELSRIGRYGVLFLGFDDGRDFKEPVEGLDDFGRPVPNPPKRELLYLIALPEIKCEIATWETNTKNPRYGLPKTYSLELWDADAYNRVPDNNGGGVGAKTEVHWTRVIHIAANRLSSEVFGTPTMEPIFNRLYDLKKSYAGSGEMLWKGGFPGFAFEADPTLGDVDLDKDSLREEFNRYQQQLQRLIAVKGGKVTALTPQLANPMNHITAYLQAVCITLEVPLRVFMGSEEGKLASTQDKATWNDRVMGVQNEYCTPFILRPLVDRLIHVGCLPAPAQYEAIWPDLNTPSGVDRVSLANKLADALSKYVMMKISQIVPFKEFCVTILGMSVPEAEALEAAQKKAGIDMKKFNEEMMKLDQKTAAGSAQPQSGSPAP